MQLMKLSQGNEAAGLKQFSKVTIHNGMAYWTGHVALKPGNLYEQTKSVFTRYDVFLPAYGQKKENILHAMAFVRDIGQYEAFIKAWKEWFSDGTIPPALTCVEADLVPGHNMEISFIVGYAKEGGPVQIHHELQEGTPYSEYVIHNNFIRFSAKTATVTGSLEKETQDIIRQYESALQKANCGPQNLLMANIYMRDISKLDSVMALWSQWTGKDAPAIMAQQSAVPEGRALAISLIAAAEPQAAIQRFETQNGVSACVKYNHVAFISAQTADATGTANQEGKEVFQKIDALLDRVGLDKKNVYFNEMVGNNFPDFNEFDVGAFKEWSVPDKIYPAAIGFSCLPPQGKAVEVSVIVAYE